MAEKNKDSEISHKLADLAMVAKSYYKERILKPNFYDLVTAALAQEGIRRVFELLRIYPKLILMNS